MRTLALALLAALLVVVADSGAQQLSKSKVDPKAKIGPKSKKTDDPPEQKFNMKMTVADVVLGSPVMGPTVSAGDLKGRVVLVDYWGIDCGPCLQIMPSTATLNAELADFGLLVLGSHVQQGTPQEVRAVATSRGANFPISMQTRVVGSEDSKFIPHSLLFDHTGACIFRGSPADAEPLIRTALGKALVDGAGREKFSTTMNPIVQDLKKGKSPAQVLPRLVTLQSSAGEVGADAKALLGSLTAPGQKKLESAQELAESKPVEAFLLIEKLPAAYKGTQVSQKATELITKLKKDKAVTSELTARPSLEAIRKIEKELNTRAEGGNPKADEFKKANAALFKQIKDRLAAMKKSWPDTKATEEAVTIAERFDVKP